MNRASCLFLLAIGTVLLFSFGVSRGHAQATQPAASAAAPQKDQAQNPETSPSSKEADKKDAEEEENPFAPEPAPVLPPGMTGADVNDPRAKLAPGLYDAGEASMGIEHLLLLKKPSSFELGTNDPDDPQVKATLGKMGIAEARLA